MIYYLETNGYIKIGYTKNIKRRLRQYRTHNPTFRILALQVGDKKLDKELKEKFKKYRYKNEFYYPTPQLKLHIETIKYNICTEYGEPSLSLLMKRLL